MKILTVALFVFIVYKPLHAFGQHNPSAHSHGKGHMTLVFDQGQLLVEMKTPAANMLGFEHKPSTAAQWRALEQLQRTLQQAQQFIGLSPECALKDSTIVLPFERAASHAAQSPKKPDDNHAHHHQYVDDHTVAAGSDKHPHPAHSDIHSSYVWHCKQLHFPKLTLAYFKHYPAFETISVEWVVNGQQGVAHLTPHKNTLAIGK